MKLDNLFTDDDRAVSPVIGVVLMVAITVILAAVIGSFVLDLSNQTGESAPQASLDVELNTSANGNFTVTHNGGEALSSSETRIVVEAGSDSVTIEPTGSSELAVGETVEFNVSSDPVGVSGSGWNGYDSASIDSGLTLDDDVTIRIIDESSQQIITSVEL